jgi:hypothetical protein
MPRVDDVPREVMREGGESAKATATICIEVGDGSVPEKRSVLKIKFIETTAANYTRTELTPTP